MAKNTQKIIGIVENNAITGIRYGEIEVPTETQTIGDNTKRRATAAAKRYAANVKKIQDTVRAPLHGRKSK